MGQDEYAEKASGLTDADRSIWDCKCGHDRAEAWDKGFEAGWAAQDPDNHAPNPYREGADR